jgi:RNA polymerase sigma-70 factor (ECF subfamily)
MASRRTAFDRPKPPPAKGPAAPAPRTEADEERRLVRQAQAGDAAALRRLLERMAVPMYRFGRHFCRNSDDAEDVMQESLAALVRTLPRWRGDAAPSTWAYVVARNTCGRMRRRKAGAPPRLESLARGAGRAEALRVAAPGADPAREFERGELGEALERALAALPVSQREVVILRDIEGLSAPEVGKVLGLGEDAVKSRLHRGRTALRRTLASLRGDVVPARRRGCPDTALLLSRHLEGEVDAATCRRLAKHVEECADCAAACDGLRSALGACARMGSDLPAAARKALRRATRALAIG